MKLKDIKEILQLARQKFPNCPIDIPNQKQLIVSYKAADYPKQFHQEFYWQRNTADCQDLQQHLKARWDGFTFEIK